MTTCGNRFYPSVIEDHIYELMEDHMTGFDTYDSDLTEIVEEYFNELHRETGVEFVLHSTSYPVCEDGGVVEVSWIENCHLHMVGWTYRDLR
jgi:hypothetical protein